MEDIAVTNYRRYIGQKVKYYKTNSASGSLKITEGILLDVKYNDETKTMDAIVEKKYKLPEGDKVTRQKCFPATDIILTTQSPFLNRKLAQPTYGTSFQMGGNRYNAASIDTMKISDDVVWTSQSSGNDPLIGKIKFIGKHRPVNGKDETVAVVEFSQSTESYPNYIKGIKGTQSNQNLVDVDDLVKLSTWRDLQTQGHRVPFSKQQQVESNGPLEGIQGHSNTSCMDATVYSLFRHHQSLDLPDYDDDEEETESEGLKNVLISKIIMPLREKGFVKLENMNKLREILADEFGNKQYISSWMDVEDFIVPLFRKIGVPKLITYDHGGKNYIYQIHLPEDTSGKKEYMTLQSLVEQSFSTSNLLLAEIPPSAFIIKLPISNGRFTPCNAVVPSAVLELSKILEMSYKHHGELIMYLQAVICLKDNHFVTFVCIDPSNPKSPWEFIDSKPYNSQPEVCTLKNITDDVIKAEKEVDRDRIPTFEPQCGGYNLYRDAYICIYVPV